MTLDLDEMLVKIKDRQWALADVDWDAPGAELISDKLRPNLEAFMSDLVWIENIGARGFAALAKLAPTENLKEIYRYFHAEEQRHANAELALMRRWGMLKDDETPEPNVNIRLAIGWLDRHADRMSMSVLGTAIPMLEVALDGALLKFLLEEVDDPICHDVFAKINADESRHLAVDFAVLDMLGRGGLRRMLIETVGSNIKPSLLLGILAYIPLLEQVRDNIVDMGLREQSLYDAMKRFANIGDRSAATRRNPLYQVVKHHGRVVMDRTHPYHRVADVLVRASNHYPKRLLPPYPTWAKELTFKPAA